MTFLSERGANAKVFYKLTSHPPPHDNTSWRRDRPFFSPWVFGTNVLRLMNLSWCSHDESSPPPLYLHRPLPSENVRTFMEFTGCCGINASVIKTYDTCSWQLLWLGGPLHNSFNNMFLPHWIERAASRGRVMSHVDGSVRRESLSFYRGITLLSPSRRQLLRNPELVARAGVLMPLRAERPFAALFEHAPRSSLWL